MGVTATARFRFGTKLEARQLADPLPSRRMRWEVRFFGWPVSTPHDRLGQIVKDRLLPADNVR